MLRKVGRAVVVAATAMLVVVGTATAALAAQNASTTCQVTYEIGTDWGYVCGDAYFTANSSSGTEKLELCDDSADGHSAVVVNIRYDLGGGVYYGWVTGGKNDCKTWVLHIPEGKAIDFEVCPGESGSGAILWDLCGNWTRGIA